MKKTNLKLSLTALAMLGAAAFLPSQTAQAHCDSLDGPVVQAARRALTESNINFVLIWVQKDDEPEIKKAFEKTLAVRNLSSQAKELADLYFFETLVRVHRAGEGASYTGLKPPGRDLGPAIVAADKALDTGNVQPVLKLLSQELDHGLHRHFQEVLARKKFNNDDLEAGRAFVKAYVEYIHYVEGLREVTASAPQGHFSEPGEKTVHPENHHTKQ